MTVQTRGTPSSSASRHSTHLNVMKMGLEIQDLQNPY